MSKPNTIRVNNFFGMHKIYKMHIHTCSTKITLIILFKFHIWHFNILNKKQKYQYDISLCKFTDYKCTCTNFNMLKKNHLRNSGYNIPLSLNLISAIHHHHFDRQGPLWPWSYGSWIYNYPCNQCLSPLKLWVWIPIMARYTWYNIMW